MLPTKIVYDFSKVKENGEKMHFGKDVFSKYLFRTKLHFYWTRDHITMTNDPDHDRLNGDRELDGFSLDE